MESTLRRSPSMGADRHGAAAAGRSASLPLSLGGDMTLLDLVLIVQEFSRSDEETARTISALIDTGRIRVRTPLLDALTESRSDAALQNP